MNDAHSLVRKGTMALLLGESSGPKSVDALELENNEGTKLLLHSDKALQPAESAEMLVEKLSGESKMKGNVVANDSREEPSNSLARASTMSVLLGGEKKSLEMLETLTTEVSASKIDSSM